MDVWSHHWGAHALFSAAVRVRACFGSVPCARLSSLKMDIVNIITREGSALLS